MQAIRHLIIFNEYSFIGYDDRTHQDSMLLVPIYDENDNFHLFYGLIMDCDQQQNYPQRRHNLQKYMRASLLRDPSLQVRINDGVVIIDRPTFIHIESQNRIELMDIPKESTKRMVIPVLKNAIRSLPTSIGGVEVIPEVRDFLTHVLEMTQRQITFGEHVIEMTPHQMTFDVPAI